MTHHIRIRLSYKRSERISAKRAETITHVSLVSFYTAREDSCVSNERLHKGNICVPLNEGRHKDLTEFKSHVISFTDIKTLPHRKGFAGVKL